MKKRGEENKSDKVENLSDFEAIEKLKELIKHNSICMFGTRLDVVPMQVRPMSVGQIDDEGNLWFLNGKSTGKTADIEADPRVQLLFSNVSDQEYLTVYGTAEVTTDKAKIKELWTPIAKAWFSEGVDDPDISAIKVQPENGFYWDTKNGRMISMIKFFAAAVTGKTMEEGVQGKLRV